MLSCDQERARGAAAWGPFLDHASFIGSNDQVPPRANASKLFNSDVFLRIFGRADAYVSPKWSCGCARQRMEKSCPEEKPRPLSTAWKLGASTGVVTNREEGRQGEPKERQRFKRLWRGNLGGAWRRATKKLA
jgi:hypothetical protein